MKKIGTNHQRRQVKNILKLDYLNICLKHIKIFFNTPNSRESKTSVSYKL